MRRFPFRIFTLWLFLLFPIGSYGQDANKPPLRWGGDLAGGAPFIYEQDGAKVGFEWELAKFLGEELNREPQFVQANWSDLKKVLLNGECDILLNGFEYIPSQEKDIPSTVPYFLYNLRLIARTDDPSIKSWDDLVGKEGKPKKRVGVLRGSFAERYLQDTFGKQIEIKSADEVGEMLTLVQEGTQLDATVQDSPAAIYYVNGKEPYEKLHAVGEPRSTGFYVILTRPQDQELREQISAAIKKGLSSGKLEAIYRKYNLWNADQERLGYHHVRPWPPVVTTEGGQEQTRTRLSIWTVFGDLLHAALYTLGLAFLSMPIAIFLGIIIAIGRMYGPGFLRIPFTIYVEVIRGTPLLLQMYFLFFFLRPLFKDCGIPFLEFLSSTNPFVFGVLGLSLNYAACEAEIYRAGLQAIPKGQMEAALALGMTRMTAIRKIILPQATRIVIPPVTNDFIALFKDTSICSMILITELMGFYNQHKSDPFFVPQLALTVGLIYLCMSYPLSLVSRRLEHSTAGRGGTA